VKPAILSGKEKGISERKKLINCKQRVRTKILEA
jgi:hypothetical protein